MVNIVWYDKNIENDDNQTCIKTLKITFPSEKYQIMAFDNKGQSINSILSNITNNIF